MNLSDIDVIKLSTKKYALSWGNAVSTPISNSRDVALETLRDYRNNTNNFIKTGMDIIAATDQCDSIFEINWS